MFNNLIKFFKKLAFLWDDRKVYPWLIKKGRFRKFYSHIWCRANVRDVGGVFLDILWKKYPSLLSMPKEVEFEITTRCGLRCVMCEHTHWDHTSYAKQDIKLDDIKKIIGPWPELRYVGIQGMGNPFLNKDFKEIIKYIDSKGIFINVVENFCEVKDDDMEIIVKHVDRIDLSLDAANKTLYEKIRPGSNFDNVVKNLQKCKQLKNKFKSPFPSFFVRIVAFKDNYDDIKNIIRLVGSLDLNNGGEVSIEISGLLMFEKIMHLAGDSTQAPEYVIKECEQAASEFNIKLLFTRSKTNPPVDNCSKWVQPFVMGNGDLVFDCGVMMSDQRIKLHSDSFGNVIEKSIRDIWNGDLYKQMRSLVNNKNAPVPQPCSECRSYSAQSRIEKFGVCKIERSKVSQFQTTKTQSVIESLNLPSRKKKIYLKDISNYEQTLND
jgi:MoaA/NifB/PqqE/SkfB family radical SAM enzyme